MYFPGNTYEPDTIDLGTGQRLRFIGANSDADIHWLWGAGLRIRAIGCFRNAVERLGSSLQAPDHDEIRILLLHHSPSYSGSKFRFIESGSRLALERFITQHRITAVLTGHIHNYLLQPLRGSTIPHSWECLEARCGTTSQITNPREWVTRLARFDDPFRRQANTAIVHRLYQEDDGIYWDARAYMLIASTPNGFEFRPVPPGTEPSPEYRLKVWPRP